jgi:hypothetical protein
MKFPRLLLALLPLAACAPVPRAAVLGVYDPDSFVAGNADRFVGCHDGRQFLTACARLADTMAVGDDLPGVDTAGRPARVRVTAVTPLAGSLYEAPYTVAVVGEAGGAAAGPVLFWRSGIPVSPVAATPFVLDSAGLAMMRAEAMRLYQAAEQARAAGERAESIELGQPIALGAEDGHVVVRWPAVLVYGRTRDPQASIFFVYDPAARRVVHGRFGHPAWVPVDPALVRVVQPLTFFRVGGDRRVYFMAREAGPWEYLGFGIYELRGGRRVLGVH